MHFAGPQKTLRRKTPATLASSVRAATSSTEIPGTDRKKMPSPKFAGHNRMGAGTRARRLAYHSSLDHLQPWCFPWQGVSEDEQIFQSRPARARLPRRRFQRHPQSRPAEYRALSTVMRATSTYPAGLQGRMARLCPFGKLPSRADLPRVINSPGANARSCGTLAFERRKQDGAATSCGGTPRMVRFRCRHTVPVIKDGNQFSRGKSSPSACCCDKTFLMARLRAH